MCQMIPMENRSSSGKGEDFCNLEDYKDFKLFIPRKSELFSNDEIERNEKVKKKTNSIYS